MDENNPYNPPLAPVADQHARVDVWRLVAPRSLPAACGWDWIVAGWRYFMMNPGIWVVNTLVYFVIMMVAGVLPFISSVLSTLFTPVFAGGLALGCRELDEGRELRVEHLFAGFRQNLGNLIGVGGFYLVGLLIVGLSAGMVIMATIGLPALLHPESGGGEPVALIGGIVLALVIALVLMVPLLMAYWFAPLLVVLNDVPPFEAMRMSFRACMVNMGPLTVYGLVSVAFALVATLPLFLGLLIFVPVMWASTYAAYKTVFLDVERAPRA